MTVMQLRCVCVLVLVMLILIYSTLLRTAWSWRVRLTDPVVLGINSISSCYGSTDHQLRGSVQQDRFQARVGISFLLRSYASAVLR